MVELYGIDHQIGASALKIYESEPETVTFRTFRTPTYEKIQNRVMKKQQQDVFGSDFWKKGDGTGRSLYLKNELYPNVEAGATISNSGKDSK